MKRILERMAAIGAHVAGRKLCRMGGRPHYNRQTWRGGKNEVRYVPKDEVEGLKKDIAGYQQFLKLAEQFADEVICITQRARKVEKKVVGPKS